MDNNIRCSGEGLHVVEGTLPADPVLAMAYVPYQVLGDMYPENVGLERGTIFPALYLPFTGKEGVYE
ncbi:MAG: spore coat associated protein CotJA [Oscillospiraceae bacterium]|nr:spore coat associated protein CotJA [Oscillospiraceae bacterium]